MSVVEPGSSGRGLVERVKSILTRPTETWATIDAEPATVGQLYRSYIIPLAAIPAIAGFIGMALVGVGVPGFGIRMGIVPTAVSYLVQYLLTLGMVFVTAMIVDGLAPTFGGTRNQIQALKVVAYSFTAAWLAGIFFAVPLLAPLALLGLYSFYLLYKGLPLLMRTPEDKAVPYIAVVIVISVLLWIVVGAIAQPLQRASLWGMAGAGPRLQVGGASIDIAELERSSKRLEDAAKQFESAARSGAPAADPEQFRAFLPERIGGFERREISFGSGGVGPLQGSGATGEYERGDARLRVMVADAGAMGAIAALGGAFNVQSSTERDGSYERIGKVGGRLTIEEYNASSRSGSYGQMIGDRFFIHAEGEGVTMDELKAALSAVDAGRLERMAKAGG